MSTDAATTILDAVFGSEQLTIASLNCSNASVSAVERAAKERAVLGCAIESDLQCTISFWLYAVSMPTLIVGGTVGNALTIVVMATKAMGKTAFGTYIAAIALTDILVLWTTLPRHFVRWIWLIDIRDLNQWSCRILRFLQFSLMNTSAWLLVTVTVERFLNIYYPTKFRQYKTRSRALGIVVGVAAVHFAWNLHIFWTLGEQRVDACTTRQCGHPTAADAYYWTKVHVWVDMSKLSLLPFVVMLSLNVAIVVSLRRRAAAKRCSQQPWHKRIGATVYVGGGVARTCAKHAGEGRGDATVAISSSSARADSTKTLMLLWVSFFYVVTTVPTFVSTVLDNAKIGPTLFSSVATVVLYVNNAANFLLYSLSGATFRRLLVATLKQRTPSATWSSSTGRRSATTLLNVSFADQTSRMNGVGGWPSPQQRRQPPWTSSPRPSPRQQRDQCQPLPPPDIISIFHQAATARPSGVAGDCDSQSQLNCEGSSGSSRRSATEAD